jgi:hypothetical protein
MVNPPAAALRTVPAVPPAAASAVARMRNLRRFSDIGMGSPAFLEEDRTGPASAAEPGAHLTVSA